MVLALDGHLETHGTVTVRGPLADAAQRPVARGVDAVAGRVITPLPIGATVAATIGCLGA